MRPKRGKLSLPVSAVFEAAGGVAVVEVAGLAVVVEAAGLAVVVESAGVVVVVEATGVAVVVEAAGVVAVVAVEPLLVVAAVEEPESAPPQPASAVATLPRNAIRTIRPDPNPRLAIPIQTPEK
jgi:hypothetical protein